MILLPLIFYIVAAITYAVAFAQRSDTVGRWATSTLVGGTLTHTFVIGMQTMQVGHLPIVGTTGAVSIFV